MNRMQVTLLFGLSQLNGVEHWVWVLDCWNESYFNKLFSTRIPVRPEWVDKYLVGKTAYGSLLMVHSLTIKLILVSTVRIQKEAFRISG